MSIKRTPVKINLENLLYEKSLNIEFLREKSYIADNMHITPPGKAMILKRISKKFPTASKESNTNRATISIPIHNSRIFLPPSTKQLKSLAHFIAYGIPSCMSILKMFYNYLLDLKKILALSYNAVLEWPDLCSLQGLTTSYKYDKFSS